MKHVVLFVDDNENILQGLRRNLRPMHQEWDIIFATSGEDALNLMAEKYVDVIVSDIRMPGIDGADLLKQVKNLYGHTIRLVLSGQCEEDSITTLLEVSHQYLPKPFETSALIATVKPLLAARDQLRKEELRKFVTGLSALPSLPSIHEAIVNEFSQAEPNAAEIEILLLRDISLVAKIFQVVNSSYFGTSGDINTVAYVWEMLGMSRIQSLVLKGHIIAPLDKGLEGDIFFERLWNLSLMTARIARLIAKAEHLPQKLCDKAWIAGLLHAIGAVVLYEFARKTGAKIADPLDAAADTDSYPLVGAFLALLWGLPQDIRYVILHHAAPGKASGEGDNDILAIIHAARAFALSKESKSGDEAIYLDESFMRQAAALDKLDVWRRAAATI